MGQCASCRHKDADVRGRHVQDSGDRNEELAKALPPSNVAEAPLPTKELYLAGVKAGAASLRLKDKLLLAQALAGGREERSSRLGYEKSSRPWGQGTVQGLGPCSSQGQCVPSTGDVTPTGTAVSSIRAHSHTSLLVIESRPSSPAASERGQGHDYSRAASGPAAVQGSRLLDSLRRVNSLGGAGGRVRNGGSGSRGLDDAAAVLAVTKALQMAPLAPPGGGRGLAPQQQHQQHQQHQRRGSIQNFPGASSPSRQLEGHSKANGGIEEGASGGTPEFALFLARGVSPSLEASSRPQPSPLGVQRPPDAPRISSPSQRQPRSQQQYPAPEALRKQQQAQAQYQRAYTSHAKAECGYMPPPTQCAAAWMRPGGESCDDIARLDGGEAGAAPHLTAVPRFHAQPVPPAVFLSGGSGGAAANAAAADFTEPGPPAEADPVMQFDAASVAQAGVCASPPAGSRTGSVTGPGPARKFLPKWTDQARLNVDLAAQPKRPALKSAGSAVSNALLSDPPAGNAAIGDTTIGNTAMNTTPVSRLSPSQRTSPVVAPPTPAGRQPHPQQSPAPQTRPMDGLLSSEPLQVGAEAAGSYICDTNGPSTVPVSLDAVTPFGDGQQQQQPREQQWEQQPQQPGPQLQPRKQQQQQQQRGQQQRQGQGQGAPDAGGRGHGGEGAVPLEGFLPGPCCEARRLQVLVPEAMALMAYPEGSSGALPDERRSPSSRAYVLPRPISSSGGGGGGCSGVGSSAAGGGNRILPKSPQSPPQVWAPAPPQAPVSPRGMPLVPPSCPISQQLSPCQRLPGSSLLSGIAGAARLAAELPRSRGSVGPGPVLAGNGLRLSADAALAGAVTKARAMEMEMARTSYSTASAAVGGGGGGGPEQPLPARQADIPGGVPAAGLEDWDRADEAGRKGQMGP